MNAAQPGAIADHTVEKGGTTDERGSSLSRNLLIDGLRSRRKRGRLAASR
jgi:hypothetical protein